MKEFRGAIKWYQLWECTLSLIALFRCPGHLFLFLRYFWERKMKNKTKKEIDGISVVFVKKYFHLNVVEISSIFKWNFFIISPWSWVARRHVGLRWSRRMGPHSRVHALVDLTSWFPFIHNRQIWLTKCEILAAIQSCSRYSISCHHLRRRKENGNATMSERRGKKFNDRFTFLFTLFSLLTSLYRWLREKESLSFVSEQWMVKRAFAT